MTINRSTKVFDNIGFKFNITDNKFIISDSIKNFTKLSSDHIGYHIPYLARNILNNEMETGVGEVGYNSIGDIVVKRLQIVKSSNNNQTVNFSNSPNNEFYIFANQSIFDNSITQVVVVDSDHKLEPLKAVYLVDCSITDINCVLPPVDKSNGLIVEFKIVAPNNNLIIRDNRESIVANINENKYIRLVCDGQSWTVLSDLDQSNNDSLQSLSNGNDFSSMSLPAGDEQSLQYKSGADFRGSDAYWDSLSNSLLVGADNRLDANIILPSSGNYPTVFNQNQNQSDFIVNGSGNRNLFFAYDGRLGINIPSGARPSTIFHVVNTICQEGFRLENRNSCHPANMTLFHKPSIDIATNSVVGQINLSSKDTNGNRVDYSRIESRAVDTTPGTIKGGIDLIVATVGTGVKVFSADPNQARIGYSGINVILDSASNTLALNANNSQILLSNNTNTIKSTSLNLQSSNILLGSGSSTVGIPGALSVGSISSNSLQSSNINIPNIAPSSFLTIDNNNKLVPSNRMSLNSLGTINLPIAPNKILSTTTNGAITGVYSLGDYFLTENDIIWNKFSPRPASICLRQVTFDNPVPIKEFSAGDQVAIASPNGNFYRTITSLDISGEDITGMILDQAVTQVTVSNFMIHSVTQGGYLSMTKSLDRGVISDSTENVFSIRPLTETVFNTKQKDINFSVYGLDDNPALYIKANTGRFSYQSGIYNTFATNNTSMFPIVVTSGGAGISNVYSAANFAYNPGVNLFSGIVSDVGSNGSPSFYGTYDQNGNAAEWVEKPGSIESRDKEEFICGGSYLTTIGLSIGASGLKSIESLPRQSGFEYVGLRVASLFNLVDSPSVSHATGLNMSFVGVVDPKNQEDSSVTYIKTGNQYSPIVINNLGVVNNTYRIGQHEVTNRQYAKFLNSVAKNNDRGLFDVRMSNTVVGGINRVSDEGMAYIVKPYMENKPVLFVSYLSAIRFINWMHNGAPASIEEEEVDYTLDIGAYNIANIGNNSFNIAKSSYRKYWLPNLNEWHKAAYYRPVDSSSTRGTSTVSIKRPDPFLVASGVNTKSEPAQLYANLSVSGWLYVDHLIVGDGTIRSAKRFTGITTPDTTNPNDNGTGQDTGGNTTIVVPRINLNAQWNNINAIVSEDKVSCVSAGCNFDAKPLRLDADVVALCTDPDLLASNNTPWWCQVNNTGPGWFK